MPRAEKVKITDMEFRKNINKYVESYNMFLSIVEIKDPSKINEIKGKIINIIIPEDHKEYFRKVVNLK